ncbi:MAG: alcohol dehydrogenase catalytic domain-containing protein, partial [Propionicimonas sp.]|nr:alcohol dehydrogenase catalytic domain-containing protein [Propionicimonas sp.]
MRAAVLHPDHRIEVTELQAPAPTDGRILVSPVAVGLCGSDVSYATKGANGAFVVSHPMVLGHEVCARLLGAAEIDGRLMPAGTLVAVHPLWPSPLAGESEVRTEFA